MSRCLLAAVVLLGSCKTLEPIDREQPCREAGYAIARRTFECTGDGDLANARYEKFRREYACIPIPEYFVDTGEITKFLQTSDTGNSGIFPPDYYHCALAIDGLACETVESFGSDIALYLASSDGCPWVAEPKGGRK